MTGEGRYADVLCRCGSGLKSVPGVCSVCGWTAAVEHGVLRLSDRDRAWDEVSEEFADRVRDAGDALDVEEALARHPADAASVERGANPAGLALLAASRGRDEGLEGDRILVTGAAWLDVPAALQFLGAMPTIADQSLARLVYASHRHAAEQREAVQFDGDRLPFRSGSYRTVFIDLTAIADPRPMLREAARVTVQGGDVVIQREAPFDRPDLGIWSWPRALRDAGLREESRLVFTVDGEGQSLVVPPERAAAAVRVTPPTSRLDRLRGSAARLGVVHALADRRISIAAHLESSPTATLADRLAGPGARIFPRDTARAAVDGRDRFVKVPLSAVQARGVADEVERTRAAGLGAWRRWVVQGIELESLGAVPVAVFPHIAGGTATGADAETLVFEALQSIPAEWAAIETSDLGRRMRDPRRAHNLRVTGGAELASVLDAPGAALPVGPVHGDLNLGNLMLTGDGTLKVIDWVRFEARSPLFIDAAFAAVAFHRRRGDLSYAAAIDDFIHDRIPGDIAAHATMLLAGLDRAEAAGWLVLHEISALQNDLPESGSSNRDRLAEAIAVVRQRLV